MPKTALISVSNKDGIADFAKGLQELGYKILSTGGTAKILRDNKIKVDDIPEYTGQKEMLDGRVKTLHPKIFAGILALRNNKNHIGQLRDQGIDKIDLVVVNLYPFEETVRQNSAFEQAIENIDIGGPSLLRAAAKNFESVLAIVDPNDYQQILEKLRKGNIDKKTCSCLALKVFQHTARYDSIISNYFMERFEEKFFPEMLNLSFKKKQELRYGENPHQKAAFYIDPILYESSIATAKQLHGKEISFNNILDVDNAFELVKEFEEPVAAVIKHTNPSGCATGKTIDQAFKKAYEADTLSAFGGAIALNRPCNRKTAELISRFFAEIVVCPEFDKDALVILKKKANLRLLETGGIKKSEQGYYIKKVSGGLLAQSRNLVPAIGIKDLKVVTKRKPTEEEIRQMLFAYKVTAHVKSNAIVFAKDDATVGIGAGQMSRVVSVKIAAEKAGSNAKGAVMSSDAFFPFRDGVDQAAKAGITAIIQPGGSVKDKEVIEAADEHGIAMVFTGVRLFWH